MFLFPPWLLSALGPAGPFLQTILAGLLSKTFVMQTVARIAALVASLIFKDKFERMKEQSEMLMFSHMRKDDLMGNNTLLNYNLKKAAAEERLSEYLRDYELCDRLLTVVQEMDLGPFTNFSKGMIQELCDRRNKMASDINKMASDVVELEKAYAVHEAEMLEAQEAFMTRRTRIVKALEPVCKWGWALIVAGLCSFVVYVTYQSVASLQPGTLFYDHFGLAESQALSVYQAYYGHEIISGLLLMFMFWFAVLPQIKKSTESFNFNAYRLYVVAKLGLFFLPGMLAVYFIGQSMDAWFAEGAFLRELLLLYVPVAGETIANLLQTTWLQAIVQILVGSFLVVIMFKKYDFGPRKVLESDEEKELLERHKDHQNDMLKSHASMRFAYQVLLADMHVSLDELTKLAAQADNRVDEEKLLKIGIATKRFKDLMEELKKIRRRPMSEFGTRLLDSLVDKVETTPRQQLNECNEVAAKKA